MDKIGLENALNGHFAVYMRNKLALERLNNTMPLA